MASVKYRIHPLFVVFGVYYAVCGKLFFFLIYTACAVMHELGHSFVAYGLGYRLDRITLMPFGALVSGETDSLKPFDQIKIALAGPFINLAAGIFIVALWWIFPETYAFTDVAAQANFSMAVVNFIPAYPLDGGRVLCAVISFFKPRKTAMKICRVVGAVFAACLFGFFVLSLFYQPNFSLLLFSAFVACGLFERGGNYVRAFFIPSDDMLKRGVPYKRFAVDKTVTVGKLASLLDPDCVNEAVIFDGGKPICTLSQERIVSLAMNGDYYEPVKKYL